MRRRLAEVAAGNAAGVALQHGALVELAGQLLARAEADATRARELASRIAQGRGGAEMAAAAAKEEKAAADAVMSCAEHAEMVGLVGPIDTAQAAFHAVT